MITSVDAFFVRVCPVKTCLAPATKRPKGWRDKDATNKIASMILHSEYSWWWKAVDGEFEGEEFVRSNCCCTAALRPTTTTTMAPPPLLPPPPPPWHHHYHDEIYHPHHIKLPQPPVKQSHHHHHVTIQEEVSLDEAWLPACSSIATQTLKYCQKVSFQPWLLRLHWD